MFGLGRLDKYLKQLVLSTIFWCSLPILYCICLPLHIIRGLLVKPLARRFHPDWGSMLNLRDTVNYEDLQNEEGLTNVLLLMTVGEGDPSIEKIRKFFLDYILNFKNYKGQVPYRKLQYYHIDWLGYIFWIKAKSFRLEDHVRVLQEFPETVQTTREQLETFLGNYYMKPFAWKFPPWELLLVKNYNHQQQRTSNLPNKQFALIFRWHTSIADGSCIAKILINIIGGDHHDSDDNFLRSGKTTSLLSSFMTNGHHDCEDDDEDGESLWSSLKLYTSSLLLLGHDTLKLLMLDNDQNPWRLSSDILTNTCHLVSTNKLPLNVARTVSKKRNVSMTAVFFASVAGGVRQYFVETGQERRIPVRMRIRVCLPMAKYPYNRLTNHWSFTNIKLPVGHPDPIQRLEKVEEMIEKQRKSFLHNFVWFLEPLVYSALPHWFSPSSCEDKGTTMTGWNFFGPTRALHLFGEYPALDFFGYVPRLKSDAAIGLTIFSYNGTVQYNLSADKALFTHRESAVKLASLIEREFLSFQNLSSNTNVETEETTMTSIHHPFS